MFGLRSDIAHPDVTPTSTAISSKRRMWPSPGFSRKGRAESVESATECGDASACLKLRIPLIRRDPVEVTSKLMPARTVENEPETAASRPDPSCGTDGT